MIANELRIGNWIDSEDGKQQIVDVLCDSINTKTHEGLPCDFIDPIPLTPEILLAFGFERLEDGDGFYYELLSANGILFIEGDKKGFTEIFLDMDNSVRVRYLHQLQNLYFALTQTELTYNP